MVQSGFSLEFDQDDGEIKIVKQKKSHPVSTGWDFLFQCVLLEFRRDSEL